MSIRRLHFQVDRPFVFGAALLFLLLTLSLLNYLTTEQQRKDAEWVSHSHEVRVTLEAIRSEVAAAASALRGYVLSGRSEDLERYKERLARADKRVERFQQLTLDNAQQQAALASLRQDLDRLRALREATLDSLSRDGRDASVRVFLARDGPQLVTQFERRLEEMDLHEVNLLQERRESSERAYRIAEWTGIGSGVLSVVFVALYFFMLQAHANASKQTADRLTELAEALRHSDQNKDAFIATLAHELRNPLAPIATAAEILLRQEADPKQVRRMAELIGRQAGHMRILLGDLLDLARITQGKLLLNRQPVLLDSVVDAALEVSTLAVEARRHRFTVIRAAPGAIVDVDAIRLCQVVTNLLNNAAGYTDPGGAIRLAVATDETDLRIHVSDTGIGLTPEAQRRIFQPFEQVNPRSLESQGGLGVGLTLTRGLVELHGGTITVRSDGLQKGSEFTVLIKKAVVRGTPAVGGVAPVTPSPQAAGY
jgi:signal transduction histidine kinase